MMRLCQRVKHASRPGSHVERLIDLPSIVVVALMPSSGFSCRLQGERVHARKKSPLFKTEIKCTVRTLVDSFSPFNLVEKKDLPCEKKEEKKEF